MHDCGGVKRLCTPGARGRWTEGTSHHGRRLVAVERRDGKEDTGTGWSRSRCRLPSYSKAYEVHARCAWIRCRVGAAASGIAAAGVPSAHVTSVRARPRPQPSGVKLPASPFSATPHHPSSHPPHCSPSSSPIKIYLNIPSSAIMKSAMLLAAGTLLGAANAKIHRMPLKKVPLDEQLVSHRETVAQKSTVLTAPETRRHPGAGESARPEVSSAPQSACETAADLGPQVHGHQARLAHGAGLQGPVHRRRHPSGAHHQLPQRSV
jgi:hypothetical protein